MSFPEAVRGSSSANRTALGTLNAASREAQKARTQEALMLLASEPPKQR